MNRRMPLNKVRPVSATLRLRGLLAVSLAIMLSASIMPNRVQAADGDLDPTFGTGGKVITDFFGSTDQANAIALQPEGKIVAAGSATGSSGSLDFALARYDSSGSLDPTFGAGGKVTTDFFGLTDVIGGIALQPDGKIVAAGVTRPSGGSLDFALARYDSSGNLDPAFGAGGKVTTDFSGSVDQAHAIALQPDGKIVVAGSANLVSGNKFALARYDSSGNLDPTFGAGGKVTTDFIGLVDGLGSSVDQARAIALQPDGKIVAAGSAARFSGHFHFALARYDSSGSLDPAFGMGGKVTTDFSGEDNEIAAIALQPDGKIVAAGFARPSGGDRDFALARYDSSGSLDPAFGMGGKVTTDFFGFNDVANAVVLQPDGKIVAAGSAQKNTSDISDFALARYDGGGNLDPAFGTGGKVTTDFFRSFDVANAVALQPDGKIVAAGFTVPTGLIGEIVSPSISPSIDFALARYQSTPTCTLTLTDASVDKPVLWPPNHKMVAVTVSYRVNNTCPTNCTLSVTSNEPINGTGDGDTSPDWQVINANRVNLRAERAGNGNGRVYTIKITCRDSAGNVAGQTVTASVPHDRR